MASYTVPKNRLRVRRGKKSQAVIDRDIEILEKFTSVYCNHHHRTDAGKVCHDCAELIRYGKNRLEHCPYDPKPACKKCPTHCYEAEQRAKVREIMKFSGIHFVKRGRIDWLIKYFLT